MMHLDTNADYLRQVEPRTESRAVRALLTTGGPRTKKLHGRYVEVYGPFQMMLNVDGISIYTRTYNTTDSDQMGQIYLGQEEIKAVLTRKAPRTDTTHELPRVANYYSEFIKRYADKVYPMLKLMRNKGKKVRMERRSSSCLREHKAGTVRSASARHATE